MFCMVAFIGQQRKLRLMPARTPSLVLSCLYYKTKSASNGRALDSLPASQAECLPPTLPRSDHERRFSNCSTSIRTTAPIRRYAGRGPLIVTITIIERGAHSLLMFATTTACKSKCFASTNTVSFFLKP